MHRRRLRWLLTAAFFCINCGPVQRREHTRIEVDGRYGEGTVVASSCENGSEHRWNHRIIGGSAAVHHQSSDGFAAEGRARVVAGTVTGYARLSLEVPFATARRGTTYGLGAFGGRLVYDARFMGGEIGGALILTDEGELGGSPYLAAKVGHLDHIWLQGAIGTHDPLYAVRVMSLGLGVRHDALRLLIEPGIYGQTALDLAPGSEGAPTLSGPFPGVHVGFDWLAEDAPGLSFGVVLGEEIIGRAGIAWTFDE